MKVNPYLIFDGTTEEAFNFYKSAFGGEYTSFVRLKDLPTDASVSEENGEDIANIALPIADDTVLMGSDLSATELKNFNIGNNVSLSIHPESRKDAERLFHELSTDGDIEMPLAEQPWGDYYGSFTDKFGVQWMVNYAANTVKQKQQ